MPKLIFFHIISSYYFIILFYHIWYINDPLMKESNQISHIYLIPVQEDC